MYEDVHYSRIALKDFMFFSAIFFVLNRKREKPPAERHIVYPVT